MWSEKMTRKSILSECRRVLLAVAVALVFGSLPAWAQQSGQNNPPPAPAKVPANTPAMTGNGPMRLPAPAEPATPQPPAAKTFKPTEQVRADADVAFPPDI